MTPLVQFAFLSPTRTLSFPGGWLPIWELGSAAGHADRDRELGKPHGSVPRCNVPIGRLQLSTCGCVFKSEFQSRANGGVQYRNVAT